MRITIDLRPAYDEQAEIVVFEDADTDLEAAMRSHLLYDSILALLPEDQFPLDPTERPEGRNDL